MRVGALSAGMGLAAAFGVGVALSSAHPSAGGSVAPSSPVAAAIQSAIHASATVAAAQSAATVNATPPASASPAAPPRSRVIYLTFDDGPGPYTSDVLDVLERNGAKATFFILGSQVSGREATIGRMVADGNAVGTHSWRHTSYLTLGDTRIVADTERTRQAAAAAAGPALGACNRPPYGATDSRERNLQTQMGVRQTLWDVDTQDWAMPGADVIAERIAAAGDGQIVLLHDGGGTRAQTVQALTQVLPVLRAEGVAFTPIPGCLVP